MDRDGHHPHECNFYDSCAVYLPEGRGRAECFNWRLVRIYDRGALGPSFHPEGRSQERKERGEQAMTDYLIQNIETLGALLAALIIIIYSIITKQWAVLRASAYSFMLSAERLMATEKGAEKMQVVLKTTWKRMPLWLRLFINENVLRKILQEWYLSGKDQLRLR